MGPAVTPAAPFDEPVWAVAFAICFLATCERAPGLHGNLMTNFFWRLKSALAMFSTDTLEYYVLDW